LEPPALGLVVQTPEANGTAIDDVVTEFASNFEQTLAELPQSQLSREKQAVISKLMERDRQLGDVSGRYWREIDRENYNFDSREQLAAAIREVTLDDLKQTFQDALIERQRALLVLTGEKITNQQNILNELRKRQPVAP